VRLGPLILYVFPSVGALLLKVAIRRVNEAASFSNCRLWKTRRGDLTAHNSGVIQVESVGHETCSEALIIFGIHEYTVCFYEYPCLFIKFKDFTDKFQVS
jgi:hypothetical protein